MARVAEDLQACSRLAEQSKTSIRDVATFHRSKLLILTQATHGDTFAASYHVQGLKMLEIEPGTARRHCHVMGFLDVHTCQRRW